MIVISSLFGKTFTGMKRESLFLIFIDILHERRRRRREAGFFFFFLLFMYVETSRDLISHWLKFCEENGRPLKILEEFYR